MNIETINHVWPDILPVEIDGQWDGKYWKVSGRGRTDIQINGHLVRLEYLPGFISDGGSIPRLLWRLMGHPMGRWLRDYMIHDGFYGTHLLPKDYADNLFRATLKQHGCDALTRNTLYWAVHRWGHTSYYDKDPRIITQSRHTFKMYIDGMPVTEPLKTSVLQDVFGGAR